MDDERRVVICHLDGNTVKRLLENRHTDIRVVAVDFREAIRLARREPGSVIFTDLSCWPDDIEICYVPAGNSKALLRRIKEELNLA